MLFQLFLLSLLFYSNYRSATRTVSISVNSFLLCTRQLNITVAISDNEDLANRASVSCSSSGRMSCQRNSASFYSFSSEATCIEPPNSQLEFENKQEAGCGRRAIIHLNGLSRLRDLSHSRRRSRPASLLRGQISSWIASTLRRLDGGCQSKKFTRSLVLKCQTVKLSAPLQIALNVTRCQLWQENINLPKFNCFVPRNCQVSRSKGTLRNGLPTIIPRCYPRLAHVHVNHLSGRAARRNHLRKHQGQCQALSWAVVSWFCRVYWLIGILIVHYGWRIKIISMKSGRAISIKRTGWIGHQSLTPGLSDVWAKNHLKYRIVDFHDKRVSCI